MNATRHFGWQFPNYLSTLNGGGPGVNVFLDIVFFIDNLFLTLMLYLYHYFIQILN